VNQQHSSVVSALLTARAKRDLFTLAGQTPLMMAIPTGNHEIMELLGWCCLIDISYHHVCQVL
jgi:ankyrin repeat protein